MVHTTRDNYKAKWLAALRDGGNDVIDRAETAPKLAESVVSSEVSAHVELQKLQTITYETASVAKSLIALLNESSTVAGVDYGKHDHEIDGKISKMPLYVVMRRVRDILKLAQFRVGMLTVACEELNEAGQSMAEQLQIVHNQSLHLKRTTVNALMLGPDPTREELDDYTENRRGSQRYNRYGIAYEDLTDDVFENFGMHANHGFQNNNYSSEHESAYDSDSDNDQQIVSVKRNSPNLVTSHQKQDSGVSGLNELLGN